jgi:hypothetical protein
MAVTNKEIIADCRLIYGIPFDLVINTFAGWQYLGYRIKKGEKALFSTKIWKPCKKKCTNENGETITTKKLLLVNAAFFSVKQVEKVNIKG